MKKKEPTTEELNKMTKKLNKTTRIKTKKGSLLMSIFSFCSVVSEHKAQDRLNIYNFKPSRLLKIIKMNKKINRLQKKIGR